METFWFAFDKWWNGGWFQLVKKLCIDRRRWWHNVSFAFIITSTKLYLLVVRLPVNDNIKFLEHLKQGFKKTISWNKCRSEIATQTKNNLDYLIDPTFRKISRLFAISFKNIDNKCYMQLVEMKISVHWLKLNHFIISQ